MGLEPRKKMGGGVERFRKKVLEIVERAHPEPVSFASEVETTSLSFLDEMSWSELILELEDQFEMTLDATFTRGIVRTVGDLFRYFEERILFEPEERNETRKCPAKRGDPCARSEAIDGTLTFGNGYLDDYGFWERPCYPCAKAYHERTGNPAWPGFVEKS
jgi:acyl carrier protein